MLQYKYNISVPEREKGQQVAAKQISTITTLDHVLCFLSQTGLASYPGR